MGNGCDPALRQTLVVLDPKDDTVKYVLAAIAQRAPERLADVVYLDPFHVGFPFNLNKLPARGVPVEIRTLSLAELVNAVSTAVGGVPRSVGGTGARQLDVLQHVLLGAATATHPASSPLLALDALVEKDGLKRLASLITSRRAKQFLENAFLSPELQASCASRLRTAFAATDHLEAMIAADTCIDIAEILAPGKIVLVPLGNAPGGLVALTTFFANLVFRLIVQELLSRPSPWRGHHVRLVVDEAHVVAPALADEAELILTIGRSKGLSLTVISQGTALLDAAKSTLLPVLFGNTPTKMVGRLAVQDAGLLSRERSPSPGVQERLAALQESFAVDTANLPDRAFVLLMPGSQRHFFSKDIDVDDWRRAMREHAAQLRAVRARYALPPSPAPRLLLADIVPQKKRMRSSPRPGRETAAAPTPQRARTRFG